MKTHEGENNICGKTGKICYSEREAGGVINSARKHFYEGHMNSRNKRGSRAKNIPRRKYYCKECGYYHVTHMTFYAGDVYSDVWEDRFYKEYDKKRARA